MGFICGIFEDRQRDGSNLSAKNPFISYQFIPAMPETRDASMTKINKYFIDFILYSYVCKLKDESS